MRWNVCVSMATTQLCDYSLITHVLYAIRMLVECGCLHLRSIFRVAVETGVYTARPQQCKILKQMK